MARAKKSVEPTKKVAIESKGECKDAIKEAQKPKMSAAKKRANRLRRQAAALSMKNKKYGR